MRVLIDAWALMTGRYEGHGFTERGGVTTTFANRPLPFFNLSTLDRPFKQADAFRTALAEARQRASDCANPSMLALSGEWGPDEWENVAAGEGWLRSMQLTGMDADQLLPERRKEPGLDFRPVEDPGTAADVGLVNALAYGMPPEAFACVSEMSLWAKGAIGIVGYDVGRPVTSAAAFVLNDIIYVAMVASVPGLHGRGYAEAAMRRVILAAGDECGKRRLWLHATDAGAPLYRSMGFESRAALTMLHLASA